jgi:hypothetical protein
MNDSKFKYTNTGSYKFTANQEEGLAEVTYKVEVNNLTFLDEEALTDPILEKLIKNYLTFVGIILTNIIHFYKKSPTLATYVLGSLGKETAGKNDQYRLTMRSLSK